MVHARQRLLHDLLTTIRPEIVVEVGCGSDLLCNTPNAMDGVEQWVIVEPASEFAAHARKNAGDRRVEVVQDFFENATSELLRTCMRPPDLVICASVLNEVPNPEALVDAAHRVLAESRGVLHANVPSALSIHRRLARKMGLIDSEYQPSARNKLLRQERIFDRESLERLVRAAGFQVRNSGGYFLKLFTHKQMESMPFLTPALLDGLWELGHEFPDLASEVFVTAEPSG
jgi:SAM-dependent methyltransferase